MGLRWTGIWAFKGLMGFGGGGDTFGMFEAVFGGVECRPRDFLMGMAGDGKSIACLVLFVGDSAFSCAWRVRKSSHCLAFGACGALRRFMYY